MKTRSVFLQSVLICVAAAMALTTDEHPPVEESVVQAQPNHPFIVPSSGTLPDIETVCSYGTYHCTDPKDNDNHWGIDIWTQESGEGLTRDSCGHLTKGNPVYAAYEGTIVGLRDVYSRRSSHGKFDGVIAMVIIEHHIDQSYQGVVTDLDVWTLYTHMAAEDCAETFVDSGLIDRVSRGDTHVEKGELLGYQGNRVMEGDDDKTHLHFQINTVAVPKSCADYADPTPYIGVDCTACPQTFEAEPDSEEMPSLDDSTLISNPDVKVLQPGQSDEFIFDIQNTGNTTWTSHQGYALINTNVETFLGASPIQTLIAEVPPGQVTRWVIPITAPSRAGFYSTRWQMAHDEEPFGSVVSCLVTVPPEEPGEGGFDIDLGSLLAEWFSSLVERIIAAINKFWEDLLRQIEEWFQRELERLWREFWENLVRQCCGANALAPAALLLSAWSINRNRHRRMRSSNRE